MMEVEGHELPVVSTIAVVDRVDAVCLAAADAERRALGARGVFDCFAETSPLLVAAESSSTPKLTRGVYAYDKTDATGTSPLEAMYTIGSDYAIPDSHSAGLRYHGAAKLISALRHRDQVSAIAVDGRPCVQQVRAQRVAIAQVGGVTDGWRGEKGVSRVVVTGTKRWITNATSARLVC
ncbi:hypothetical protein [Burkholderia ubonensis]|uniref:hypothetical protein n=1 Tax=Burkholderia ubonensis TaxID=101571 RepID=UPI000B011D4B|nr:hypothetical protein [Burkholderia ubonensis]